MSSSEGVVEQILWHYCPWCGVKYSDTDDSCSRCQMVRFSSKKVSKKPPWKKILYAKQPYDDNYFDDNLFFLQGLERNINIVEYEYFDVVKDSAVVTLQVTTVALFCMSVEYVYSGRLALPWMIFLGFFLTVAGFIVRVFFTSETSLFTAESWTNGKILADIKLLLLVFVAVWMLSPLLRTLTQPFSDDTILALSVALFTIHLFTQDYAYMSGLSKNYTAPVSLNAAIFASVLLVSRLPSVFHVYSVICVAIELFALFPILRRSLKVYSEQLSLVVTWSLAAAAALLLMPIGTVVTLVYVISILFITFVCPYWLTRIQRYKNTIHGPWDEAVPTRNQPHWKL